MLSFQKWFAAFWLWIGCLIAAAAAQEKKPQADDLGAPGPEHKTLDALAGDWNVTLKIPIGPDKEMEGESTCQAQWVFEGRFLRLEYTSTFMGKPLTVVRYLGFDRHKAKFVETHFESTHTDVMHSEGTLSDDGKVITCLGTHIDMASGKPVQVRTETTFVDGDTFSLKMVYADAAGHDAKAITLAHKRRADKK